MSKQSRKIGSDVDELIISDLGVNKDTSSRKIPKFNFRGFNIKHLAIVVLIIIVLATIVFVFRFMNDDSATFVWKVNLTKGSENVNNKSVEYTSFSNGLMRISNDGITYVDGNGNVNWTISYNVKDPIYVSNDKYFAIADRNDNNFYIFDEKGLTGENTTTNPIVKIALSKDGVLYVMQSDDNNSYINVFRSSGAVVDISIKTNITEDGMPIDISTSDSGEELAVCYVCLTEDKIYTKATYYNFADAGKNANSKRIVGEFVDEFNDKFLARCHFFNDARSCLVSDDGIYYVSTSDSANPKITSLVDNNSRISSISYNENYFAAIYDDKRLMVYDDKGATLCDRIIDIDYTNFYLSSDYIVFINNNRVVIYDIHGRILFDKELASPIEYVAKRKSLIFTELLVGLIDGVECIRFY